MGDCDSLWLVNNGVTAKVVKRMFVIRGSNAIRERERDVHTLRALGSPGGDGAGAC